MATVAQKFAHTLKEIGVRYVFGVPSGNMIDYIEALREEEGIDFVLTGHEGAAAFMAAVCGADARDFAGGVGAAGWFAVRGGAAVFDTEQDRAAAGRAAYGRGR